ncbi:hypothetical protein K501DRAFT_287025 [Backusella circina FSU 941]|nr:hypothetical protein K501DRAFT_287025 [Backusella circina FSU 941]
MSSLTSLSVNKNKAKFAPKANRNKVRKRPQLDAAITTTIDNEEPSSNNKDMDQVQDTSDSNIKPRELSPPPPPPITQKVNAESHDVKSTPEVGSPSTPTPNSPIPAPITFHVPSISSSKKESSSSKSDSSSSKKEASKKISTKKSAFSVKKASKKSSSSTKITTAASGGVSFNTPGKGTSFAAPSRSGATSITIGDRRPRTGNDKENLSEEEEEEEEKIVRKNKKKRLEDLRPEELQTLDDIDFDPARLDDLDRPMAMFTRDLDGIVSKNFREMEKVRYAQKDKLDAMKRMTKEELEILKKNEEEEKEKKKRQLEKEKEENERKRQESENAAVLEESSQALQVRIVDGQIVLDMDSLTVERPHGTAAYEEGSMEVVEESSTTRKVNSKTYGKHTQTRRWSKLETEDFYEAISQFGTDFEMIAHILPGRTRNMVRSKFNKEEKVNPQKVTDYLINKRKKMDLEKYKAMTGIEFEEVPDDFHEMEIA